MVVASRSAAPCAATAHVSPLVAAAVALHVADMEPDIAGATKLEIF